MNETREQRLYTRFQADMPIWFRDEQEKGEYKLVEIANISAGGMLFTLDYGLEVGARIEVRFELPQDHDLVRAIAEVRHSRKNGDNHQIGIRFLEVKNHTVEALMAYLEALFI